MTFTTERITNPTANFLEATPSTLKEIDSLSVDETLGLLWVIYENLGDAITPAATGSARLQFAEGLLNQVKALSHDEQLGFMRDLVNRVRTPLTRSYGVLTDNTKLAFWYQLAELMVTGEVVPVPDNYKLSNAGARVFYQITKLDFNQQITVLRKCVVKMGFDPLAM